MSKLLPPSPNPCSSCPYRRDIPSGVWSEEDYEKLRGYDKETHDQFGIGMFQCHQNDADDDRARLCGGWTAVHGPESLALRLAVVTGELPGSVMSYETKVPLFGSGNEAADYGEEEIDCPGEEAEAMMAKITRTRPRVGVALIEDEED